MRRRYREAHWYYRGGAPPTPGRTRRRWRRFVAHCRQSVGHVRLAVVEAVVERRRSVAIAALVAGLVALTYFGGQLIGGRRPPNGNHEAMAPHVIPSRASLQPDTIALHGVEQASLPDTAKPSSSVSHAKKDLTASPPSKAHAAAVVAGPSGSAAPPAAAAATTAAPSDPSPTSTDVGPSSAVATVAPPSSPPTTTDPPPTTTTTSAPPPTSTTTEPPPTTTTTSVVPTTTLPGQ